MKRLLIRFDDLNPNMSKIVLEEIKNICKKYKNSILLCVIPFCKDQSLIKNKSLGENFWEVMRICQKENSVIGLHGYKHILTKNTSSQIFPLSNKTEFSGVDFKKQFAMIKKGKDFLESKGLNVQFFAAPAHSMDENTILVLKNLNINVVSDGFFSSCTLWKGMKWIPLKTWRESSLFLGDLNTVCKHPREINGKYEFKLTHSIERTLTSFESEINKIKKITISEIIIHNIYLIIFKLYRFKKIIKIFR